MALGGNSEGGNVKDAAVDSVGLGLILSEESEEEADQSEAADEAGIVDEGHAPFAETSVTEKRQCVIKANAAALIVH